MVLSAVGWALPDELVLRKMLHRHAHKPVIEAILQVRFPLPRRVKSMSQTPLCISGFVPLAYSDRICLLADPQISQRPVHLLAPLLGILDVPDARSATSIKPSLLTHSEIWPPSLFSLFPSLYLPFTQLS